MSSILCCASLEPYKSTYLDHESKFADFMRWSKYPAASEAQSVGVGTRFDSTNPLYAVQLVRQVNYGSLETKRYFLRVEGQNEPFVEVTEEDIIQLNYAKLNSYKNFRCLTHDKFFEVNLYQKDPINKHHWRANIARPAADIDL